MRPTWAEIDLRALTSNYRKLEALLRSGSPPPWLPQGQEPRLISVVKANAYGHGAVQVARALSAQGATAFAVAIVEEGIALRAGGIREQILVLEGAWPGQERDALEHGLTLAAFTPESVLRLQAEAEQSRITAAVHIKIDTGMTRLGARWDGIGPLLAALGKCGRLAVDGCFSHLSSADDPDPAFTREQIRRFASALGAFLSAGFRPREIHIANSAGLLFFPELSHLSARPGIALYGYAPAPALSPVQFEPVMTVKSRICHLQTIAAGESVGYNRRFTAARATRAATIPVGYADGYRRQLSGSARVLIAGKPAEVIGAVSMDMIVADVTDLPAVAAGTEVVLLGASEQFRFDAASWADLLGTIPYEILCGISPRVPRVYLRVPAE